MSSTDLTMAGGSNVDSFSRNAGNDARRRGSEYECVRELRYLSDRRGID